MENIKKYDKEKRADRLKEKKRMREIGLYAVSDPAMVEVNFVFSTSIQCEFPV